MRNIMFLVLLTFIGSILYGTTGEIATGQSDIRKAIIPTISGRIAQDFESTNSAKNDQARAVIFSDNFSGPCPGNWVVGHDGGGGSYAWAWWAGHSFAYCYGNPNSGTEYYYPNNLHVFMERRNVSLSGYGAAELTFYKKVDTEVQDVFSVNIRDQYGSWHQKYTESGNHSYPLAWEPVTINLNEFAGQSGLYIQFRFDSDYAISGNPSYEGVYVVNVTLSASTLSAPVATAATSISTTGFTAKWNSSSGASSYRLDVSTNSSFSSYVNDYQNLAVSGTSRSVTGLNTGTTYYYRVRAVTSSGTTSGHSNTINTTTKCLPPVAMAAQDVSAYSFRAYWQASNGASSYRFDLSTNRNFSSFVGQYDNYTFNGTNRTVFNLSGGITYYYRLRAVNSAGSISDNSNTMQVTTLMLPPAPVATSASYFTQNSFQANWNSSTGAAFYRLDVSTSSSFGSYLNDYYDLQVNSLNCVVTGLTASTEYYYRVRAVNVAGISENSNVINCRTSPPNKVATPSITPSSGTHSAPLSVSITCSTSNASIRYTINNSTPTSSSTLYTGPFNLSPGSYTVRAKAFRSGYTDSNEATARTYIVNNPSGTINVTVKNKEGCSSSLPGAHGLVMLYNSSNTYLAEATTNSSGIASFTNRVYRTYHLEAYHNPSTATPFGAEYWGSTPVNHISANTSVTLTRHMPIGTDIRVFNNLNNQDITDASVSTGTQLRFEVTVMNPSTGAWTVRPRLLVDRNKLSGWDFDQTPTTGAVIPGNNVSHTYSFFYTPQNTGPYYAALGVYTNVSSGSALTDGWDWASTPIVMITENQPPIALASDISQQPPFIYPDTPVPYEVKAKYYDQDGRDNLQSAELVVRHTVNNTNHDLIMKCIFYPLHYEKIEGGTYFEIQGVVMEPITDGGIQGYCLTWRFTVNSQLAATENGIKYGVKATNVNGLVSNLGTYVYSNFISKFKSYGITFVSHGAQITTSSQVTGWMTDLALSIKARVGNHAIIGRYNTDTGKFMDLNQNTMVPSAAYHDKEVILLFDWMDDSGTFANAKGYSEAAADAAFAALMEYSNLENFEYLHLIGHSRGTVICSEITERLLYHSKLVRHVTYLDPHDWGLDLGGLGSICDDYDINDGLNIPFPDMNLNHHNSAVVGWSGVVYNDTYYQQNGWGGGITSLNGRAVQGTLNNKFGPGISHSGVHENYKSSIDSSTYDFMLEQADNTVIYNHDTGYQLSRIGSYKGLQFGNQVANGPKQAAPYDCHNPARSINNGDFKWFGVPLPNTIPGWSYHGGTSALATIFHSVQLGSLSPLLRHNRFYIPEQGTNTIYFKYRVLEAFLGTNDILRVYLNNEVSSGGEWPITQIMGQWANASITIPANLKGKVCTLTAELVDPTREEERIITSNVWLDDFQFSVIPTPQAPTNLSVAFNGSLTPQMTWSSYQIVGAPGQWGYQVRVRNHDTDAIVYDTGFISSSNGHSHSYSPGAYTGIDAVTGEERFSYSLEANVEYHWHVRYRALNGEWSLWANDTPNNYAVFTTPIVALTAPVALPATNITQTGFQANWSASTGATNYRLDVSRNSSFNPLLNGYSNISVTGTNHMVTGLYGGMTYYYRVRAVSGSIVSSNSSPISVTTAYIKVTNPNTNVAWQVGTNQQISWEHANTAGNLKIELVKGPYNSLIRTISSTIGISSTSYTWALPNNIAQASDYRIRIKSLTYPDIVDYSDNYFSINQPPSIAVTSPQSAVTWYKGQDYEVRWAYNLVPGNVKIMLFRGTSPTILRILTSSIQTNNGVLYWTIPTDLTVATNYRIRITSISMPSVYADSPYFSIQQDNSILAAPINVQINKVGNTISLSWNAITGATSYRVESSANANSGFTLLTNTTNTSYSTTASPTRKFFRIIAKN